MADNIVLIGFMGSGKSAVSTSLSELSGFKKIDTDTIVESKEGMTISEIFKRRKESYFRQVESDICKTLPSYHRHIIATGGGIILKAENREYLAEAGYIVYLKASPDTLVHRLTHETNKRPLLDLPHPDAYIRQMLMQRDPIYSELASVTVVTDTKSIFDVANEIWHLYKDRSN